MPGLASRDRWGMFLRSTEVCGRKMQAARSGYPEVRRVTVSVRAGWPADLWPPLVSALLEDTLLTCCQFASVQKRNWEKSAYS